MAINLQTITDKALGVAFGLGSDMVKAATYVRPATMGPNGQVAANEIRAACSVIVGRVRPFEVRDQWYWQTQFTLLVRNSELSTITGGPAKDDFVLLTVTGERFDVVEKPVADGTGKMYLLKCVNVQSEDWGDLTTHSNSEDRGDLTAYTDAEDWGGLFENLPVLA